MAKKVKTAFICNNCGFVSYKWLGKCPECESWNSFIESIEEPKKMSLSVDTEATRPVKLEEIKVDNFKRITLGISELDNLVGGGFVTGSVVLIGGEPGIGKSTLMLQLSSILADKDKSVLYMSAEESKEQIKMRASRLKLKSVNFSILSTNIFEAVQDLLEKTFFDFVIIDSVQTFYSKELMSPAGTISQVRYITYNLVELAKKSGVTVFIIGQITKEGLIAGPKVLEHLVDTVLYFEGDYSKGFRILRATKNRFGPSNEVALFEMKDVGLTPLNMKQLFSNRDIAGKSMASVIEGSRAFVLEIQSLVTPTYFNYPRRNVTGYDLNRLHMLIAILDKRYGLNISSYDIYINIAGGFKITETAADLSVCASIISSYKNIIIPSNTLFIGEVSLSGGVASVSSMDLRISQALKYGFKKVYVPKGSNATFDKLQCIQIENIEQLELF